MKNRKNLLIPSSTLDEVKDAALRLLGKFCFEQLKAINSIATRFCFLSGLGIGVGWRRHFLLGGRLSFMFGNGFVIVSETISAVVVDQHPQVVHQYQVQLANSFTSFESVGASYFQGGICLFPLLPLKPGELDFLTDWKP